MKTQWQVTKYRHGDGRSPKEEAVRRRLLNSILTMVDQPAINAGFDFRR